MRGNQWKKGPIGDRFWEKVQKGEPAECWPWLAYTRVYGAFLLKKGRYAKAHRMAWELANGRTVPDGLCVCHSCDNPPCCNPAHLFIGSRAVNNLDRMLKGRTVSANAAKLACKRGHVFTPDNITWNRGPYGPVRKCRACARERERIRRHTLRHVGVGSG